jgi:DNA-binding winged helix-turn-helix (wHTH) protein/TolB-like protein
VIYRFGIFDFDAESGQLRRNARPLPLERQPALVLAVLVARAGELVSREELRDIVWGQGTHVDFDRGLSYCLSHVRGALGDRSDNPRFIQTIPRRGYTFIAPVTVEPPHIRLMEAGRPGRRFANARTPRVQTLAAASFAFVLLAAWFLVNRRPEPVLIAVSIFDNETGVAEYDRPVAGLADLVVANLTNLAPDRLAVIGNADVLRRPRNIRSLTAVADGVRADYVLLGQLQQGEQGLRFVTHFIRLRDRAHLKANRLLLNGAGISELETAVVEEFERATREHLLTRRSN